MAGAVLAVIAFAQLDAGDLGNRVRLIGRLQRAGQERILAHRLRGHARVDAARAEEQQFLHAVVERRIDDVRLHHQVLVDEIGRIRIVGVDPPDLGGSQVDHLRLFGREERPYSALVGQVEFGPGAGHDVGVALLLERAQDGRANHAAMAGHKNFWLSGGVSHYFLP
jgi:hypothetical protein